MYVCMYVCTHIYIYIDCLSLSVYLSIYLYIYIYLFIYVVTYQGLGLAKWPVNCGCAKEVPVEEQAPKAKDHGEFLSGFGLRAARFSSSTLLPLFLFEFPY